MEEEVFDRTTADALTLRIAERLGERQKKLDRMAEWERRGSKVVRLRPIIGALAVAACVAVALVVVAPWRTAGSPWDELGLEVPTAEALRAASAELAEVQQLIEAENYDEALNKVVAALEHSDRELRLLHDALADGDDEVLLYEAEAEQMNNDQLRWTYIYLLVRAERNADARAQLKRYLKHRDAEHREEAKALMRELKVKS